MTEETYKVYFSDDLGGTWRLETAFAPAFKAIRSVGGLLNRGYDRDLSIRVDRQPPREDGMNVDVVIPGEDVLWEPSQTVQRQKDLFGDPA